MSLSADNLWLALQQAKAVTRTTSDAQFAKIRDLLNGLFPDTDEQETQIEAAKEHLGQVFYDRVRHADALREAKDRTIRQALARQPVLPIVNGTLTLTTRVRYLNPERSGDSTQVWAPTPQGDPFGGMLIDVCNAVGQVIDSAYATEGKGEIRPCGTEAPLYWTNPWAEPDLSKEV